MLSNSHCDSLLLPEAGAWVFPQKLDVGLQCSARTALVRPGAQGAERVCAFSTTGSVDSTLCLMQGQMLKK